MYKLPFYVGGIISYFVPGRYRRRSVRGQINVFLFRGIINRFVERVYGVRVNKIRFVRQVSMNRMICVVNGRYYVKIFRDVSVMRLKDYKFLLDFIRPYLNIKIPEIFVHDKIPMYVADKLPGKDMRDFGKSTIIKHEKKIKSQMIEIINALQSVSVKSIPDNERFLLPLQPKKNSIKPKIGRDSVLAHLDLNASNIRLDDNFDVVSIVDWDSLSIVDSPNIDKDSFEKLWNIYKNSK